MSLARARDLQPTLVVLPLPLKTVPSPHFPLRILLGIFKAPEISVLDLPPLHFRWISSERYQCIARCIVSCLEDLNLHVV